MRGAEGGITTQEGAPVKFVCENMLGRERKRRRGGMVRGCGLMHTLGRAKVSEASSRSPREVDGEGRESNRKDKI
jgi:hypothetical protein